MVLGESHSGRGGPWGGEGWWVGSTKTNVREQKNYKRDGGISYEMGKTTNATETYPTGVDELQDCKEVDLGGSQDTDDFAACDDCYDGDGDDVMSNDDGGSSML